ncbi:MAG TPA: hypothetical protein VFA05_12120 [Gaiellaceae bacterium]|nr:hypothetical protein [Gaiellaceae bacterium]
MATWVWIVIAVAIVAVVAIVVWRALAARRTRMLQERFGPEYERASQTAGSRREAEAELEARQQRREQLDIRPLSPQARQRYATQWEAVQAQFVDTPAAAVATADGLVNQVMAERGYPMDEFEQRAADVSVDHPQVVDNYRSAHAIFERSRGQGGVDTEELRRAMQHYRALFDELLGDPDADRPLAREERDGNVEVLDRDRHSFRA